MKTQILSIMLFLAAQVVHAEISVRDWSLPASFDSLTLTESTIVHSDTGVITYKIRINAHLPKAGLIKGLRLERFPKHVLIDKAKHVGVFEETLDATGADAYFETGGVGQAKPFPPGLYVLSIKMKKGGSAGGLFYFGKSNSPASPTVTTPSVGEVFANGNPSFAWQNFFSPEYDGKAHRKVYVRVYQGMQNVWAAYQADADMSSITVGNAPSQEGVSTLTPGPYEAHIVYREVKPVGKMWVGREYRSIVPFAIQ
jgi:hypothetical protein